MTTGEIINVRKHNKTVSNTMNVFYTKTFQPRKHGFVLKIPGGYRFFKLRRDAVKFRNDNNLGNKY